MEEVDAVLVKLCGLPSDCLPDYGYYACYRYYTPEETAAKAWEYAKTH